MNKSRNYFKQSINLEPNIDAFWQLAIMEHAYFKNFQQASVYYEKAYNIDTTKNLSLINDMCWFYFESREYEKAEHYFKMQIQLESSPEAYNMIIHFYFLLAKYELLPKLFSEYASKFGYPQMVDFFNLHLEFHTKLIDEQTYLDGIVYIISQLPEMKEWIEIFIEIESKNREILLEPEH